MHNKEYADTFIFSFIAVSKIQERMKSLALEYIAKVHRIHV